MPDSTSVRARARGYAERTRCSIFASPAASPSSRSSIPPPASRSATSRPAACPEANHAVARRARRAGPVGAHRARGARLAAEGRRPPRCASTRASWPRCRRSRPGRRWRDSLGGVEAGIAAFEAYAELGPLERGRPPRGDLVLREPRGVVAILMPWCDPLAASCGALAAALVAGNAVVLKPSEKAPLAAERMAELLDLGGDPAAPARRRARRAPAGHAPRRRPRDAPGRGGRGQPPGDRRRGRRPGVGGRARSRRARSRAPASRAARSSASTCTARVAEPFLDALTARARGR